jgi:hypothetical protein
MKFFKYIFLSLFVSLQLFALAQTESETNLIEPMNQQQRLDSLIGLQKKLNTLNSSIPGYRVQIFFESGNYSKAKAMEVKDEFEAKFQDYKAYVSFNEPYYRVRVGDFRTKIEAKGFLKRIVKLYSNAFEVKDMISFDNFEDVNNI